MWSGQAILNRLIYRIDRDACQHIKFFLFDHLGLSVIVTRNKNDEIKAFHNVCRHRDAPLVMGRGQTKRFTCPYHSWSYNLNGELVAVPEEFNFACLERSDRGLIPKLVYGGGRPAHLPKGFFTDITLFDDVDNKSTIAQEEVFGPVGAIISFDTDEEAIRIANESNYGLGGAIMTADPARAYEMALQIRTGTISINGGTGTMSWAPFGGFRRSGIGREYSRDWLREFQQEKSIFYPAGR